MTGQVQAVALSAATLGAVSAVATPQYARSEITVGIVHLGVGGFHRSHQAWYLHRLMAMGEALDWGICGVGVLPQDAGMKRALTEQDFLYALALKHPDGTREVEIIGSMVEYLLAPDDPEAVIERMCDPRVRIVSLTVTEGGYNLDHRTGAFAADAPDIVHDLAHPAWPRTHFGLVTEALARRRNRGVAAFTVQSCDNIQGNGDVAHAMYVAFAELRDPELAAWIADSVAFPNAMVDRITPVTTDEDRRMIAADAGVADAWPVVAEPFAQWVIEDYFPEGRPAWERVGAQLVADVEPYELMKLRLLNASHQAMAYFGILGGYRYAHEAMADDRVVSLLREYMAREALPTLHPVPGVDLARYREQLIERFGNPQILDTLARLAAESSDRITKWVLPVIRRNLETGGAIDLAAAVVASWARYAVGVDERGGTIVVVDQMRDTVLAAAARQSEDPLAFVRQTEIFGDLAENGRFAESFLQARALIEEHGALAAIQELLATRP